MFIPLLSHKVCFFFLPYIELLNLQLRSLSTETYCHVYGCDYRPPFGLVDGFIDHLYTRLGNTSKYSASANLQNSQITKAPAKFVFPVCCVISRSQERSFRFTRSSPFLTAFRIELPNKWLCPSLITSRHGPRRKHFSFLPCVLHVPRIFPHPHIW
jgi:hypothetical protein